jgi:SEC-C motif/Protein of unknown function (DUF1186)
MIKFDETKAGKDAPESHKMSSYAITGNFQETDSPYRNIPQIIAEQMSELHKQSLKGNVQIIKKLERLIGQYPKVPALYSYLSVAYMSHGNATKFHHLNDMIAKQFPDYSVSKINQANRHLVKNELDEVEAILGHDMELTAFLPNRQIYHISEVAQFYETTVRFFIRKRQFEVAESRLNMVKELSAKFDGFHDAKIKQLENEKADEWEDMRYENFEKYEFEETRKPWVETSDTMPVFTHPEIHWLYENGFEISKDKIEQLLALPRTTLIQDLHKVLDDAMARFDDFEGQEWDEEKMNFSVHALFLLAELRATESLSHALNLIRQDNEWVEFWFGDLLTETFAVHFYKMMGDDLSILKHYLLEPNNEAFQRAVIPSAISILGYHHPERRQESIAFLEDILNDFYENRNDYKDIIDITLINYIVHELIELQSKDSYPLVEKLYLAFMVSDEIMGDLAEIKKAFFEGEKREFSYKTIPTIFDHYQTIIGWDRIMTEEERADLLATMEENEKKIEENDRKITENKNKITQLLGQAKTETPKVGRNDPCPCGSGKKYKKCHGG